MRLTAQELSSLYDRNPDLHPFSASDAMIYSRPSELEPVKVSGPTRDEMNQLESDYAAHLELLQKAEALKAWWYHPFNLRLAKKHFYEVDFGVVPNDGTYEIHETKSFMREDALNRLKVAARIHPFRVLVVRREGAGFELTDMRDWPKKRQDIHLRGSKLR